MNALALYSAQVVSDLPAQTSRNETLDWVYTACVWHIVGPQMARAYIERPGRSTKKKIV